ncbi:hydantoinase/oxoprolinase family protein [Acetobacter okinawensis]|uniref:hydantoinase/oxoprolinase family protein n=1 Tax=Acetobacter okinawensis TaxID=1076594 RepID=UPI002011C2B0|nr:hydantoinase/oxoprolinase family protein [Acetobacter okinawensis]
MMTANQGRENGIRVGVDTGGTFTDISIYNPQTGKISVWKVSSVTDNPSEAIISGVQGGLETFGYAATDVDYLGHGTTVATNALITGNHARTGMVTTAGFRDVLEIRRQTRADLYDLQQEKTPVLALRDLRHEVQERVNFDGSVHIPLNIEDVRRVARILREQKVEAVAVCFLFSYLYPEHEEAVKSILEEEIPGIFVSSSSEVVPVYREYERFSTTVVNAALGPIMQSYLNKLWPRLQNIGVNAPVHLTQSNGGVISLQDAAAFPVRTVLSGPAAGVVGALQIGLAAGFPNMITFDMGGTSSDVALIDNGEPQLATDIVAHGYPLKIPMLDIHAVGAGGGSIAYVDSGGHLKVGPHSAGAVPGPVCYGQGNVQPTVTDANVVLQVQNPTHLLGGRLAIDQAKAREAIAGLAATLGLGVMETAQGIISVATANMAKAIRVISVERGYDPRDYVLMAFGGAGPVHAARLARELEVPRVLIPRNPGILCSMGLLMTDLKAHFTTGRMIELSPAGIPDLIRDISSLDQQATDWFEREGIALSDRAVSRSLDVRYLGQAFELTVEAPAGVVDEAFVGEARRRFEVVHQQMYGFVSPEEPIRVVAVRLEAIGAVPRAALVPDMTETDSPVEDAIIGERAVWLPETGSFTPCTIYERDKLLYGHCIAGPAIIEQMDSTTFLLPGQIARVDGYLNLLIEESV